MEYDVPLLLHLDSDFSGIASLVLDPSKTRLFAGCKDNIVYQYDCAAFKEEPGK